MSNIKGKLHKDVAMALGRELTPGKVEPVRGQLRKLADRGWLKRKLLQTAQASSP